MSTKMVLRQTMTANDIRSAYSSWTLSRKVAIALQSWVATLYKKGTVWIALLSAWTSTKRWQRRTKFAQMVHPVVGWISVLTWVAMSTLVRWIPQEKFGFPDCSEGCGMRNGQMGWNGKGCWIHPTAYCPWFWWYPGIWVGRLQAVLWKPRPCCRARTWPKRHSPICWPLGWGGLQLHERGM